MAGCGTGSGHRPLLPGSAVRELGGAPGSGQMSDSILATSLIVAAVGAGLMAAQIALLFLRRMDVPVVMKDIKQDNYTYRLIS